MSPAQPTAERRKAFAEYVSRCTFFDERGFLDLEQFCLHLYLSLFCDGAPAPQPIELYELMLKRVGQVKDRKKFTKIYKEQVADWKESLRSYYPDQQRTWVHFDLLAEIYPEWILAVGTQLLGLPNPGNEKGHFWIKAEWPLVAQYLGRFEVELVRSSGLSRFLSDSPPH